MRTCNCLRCPCGYCTRALASRTSRAGRGACGRRLYPSPARKVICSADSGPSRDIRRASALGNADTATTQARRQASRWNDAVRASQFWPQRRVCIQKRADHLRVLSCAAQTRYASPRLSQPLGKFCRVPCNGRAGREELSFSHFRLARSHAVENAEPDAATEGWPLLVFNHGAVSPPTQCTILNTELASHGFVVLSVGRPGESSGIAWPVGTVTPVSAQVLEGLVASTANKDNLRFIVSQDVAERRSALEAAIPYLEGTYVADATRRWRDDSIGAVDSMLNGDVPEFARPLAAKLDANRIGYFGFSLGGSVAHACCMADPRAKAGINIDGFNWLFDSLDQPVPTPFLNISGDPRATIQSIARTLNPDAPLPDISPTIPKTMLMSNDFFYERPEAAGLRSDVIRIVVPGTSHGDFTDVVLGARSRLRGRIGGGKIDGMRMLRIQNALCVGFFDRYLNGASSSFPNDVLGDFPELVHQDLAAVRAWAAASARAAAG